jgi:hypothetical protein
VQAVALAPSSEQVKVALVFESVNSNEAVVVFTYATGFTVMVGVGVITGGAATAVPPTATTNAAVTAAVKVRSAVRMVDPIPRPPEVPADTPFRFLYRPDRRPQPSAVRVVRRLFRVLRHPTLIRSTTTPVPADKPSRVPSTRTVRVWRVSVSPDTMTWCPKASSGA